MAIELLDLCISIFLLGGHRFCRMSTCLRGHKINWPPFKTPVPQYSIAETTTGTACDGIARSTSELGSLRITTLPMSRISFPIAFVRVNVMILPIENILIVCC